MSDTMRDAAWKLVPVEPTEAMIEAGRHVKRMRLLDSVKAIREGRDPEELMGKTAGAEYRAMLEAAPAPPVPSSVQEIMRLVTPYLPGCVALEPLEIALTALVDENHRLKFELDGVNAMRGPEWQPIESAPKDGPLILLGLPADDECDGVALPGWWQEAYDDAPDEMGSDAGFVDCFFQYFRPGRSFGTEAYRDAGIQPTHWQPMPPPPTPGIEPEQTESKTFVKRVGDGFKQQPDGTWTKPEQGEVK